LWRSVRPVLEAAAADESRFAGVTCLGVDEHVWHHVSTKPVDQGGRGPKEFTGMVDLSRDKDGHLHARLLDLVPGRSGEAYKTWLHARGDTFRKNVKVAKGACCVHSVMGNSPAGQAVWGGARGAGQGLPIQRAGCSCTGGARSECRSLPAWPARDWSTWLHEGSVGPRRRAAYEAGADGARRMVSAVAGCSFLLKRASS
jgi:hypothetical protein